MVASVRRTYESHIPLQGELKGKVITDKTSNDTVKVLSDMARLFDIAACKHNTSSSCHCPTGTRVPDSARKYLLDQRGEREYLFINTDVVSAVTVSRKKPSTAEDDNNSDCDVSNTQERDTGEDHHAEECFLTEEKTRH